METQKGKLIVIEGTDGCGKETQAKKLQLRLAKLGIASIVLSFPFYESLSSGPVRMFLDGTLGDRKDMTPEQISMLYAVDRFCKVKQLKVKELLEKGVWFICDRYCDSNIIYQTASVDDPVEKESLEKTLYSIEYQLFDIPRPDKIIYLHVKRNITKQLVEKRGNEKDINESNDALMQKVDTNGYKLAKRLQWNIIECVDNDTLLSIQDISDLIIDALHLEIFEFLSEYENIKSLSWDMLDWLCEQDAPNEAVKAISDLLCFTNSPCESADDISSVYPSDLK